MSTHFASKKLMQNALIWYISTHFVTKNIDAFSIDLIYIKAKNLTVRIQNLLASGPLLIMRLNYYSKAFGCVGCFQA